MKEQGRKPQTKSYLWSQMTGSGVPIRCVTYTPDRGAKLADKLFAGIRKGAVSWLIDVRPIAILSGRFLFVHVAVSKNRLRTPSGFISPDLALVFRPGG